MNPFILFWSMSTKDPQEILQSIQKFIEIMGVTPTNSPDQTAYQLNVEAHILYKQLKDDRGTDVELLKQDEFVISFLDMFFFLKLGQGAGIHKAEAR